MKRHRPFQSANPNIDNIVKTDIWAPINHMCSRAISLDESVCLVIHHWPENNIAGILRILRNKKDGPTQECLVQAIEPGKACPMMPFPVGKAWALPYWLSGTLHCKITEDFISFVAAPDLPDIAETSGLFACGTGALIVDTGPLGGLWYLNLDLDAQWRSLPRPPAAGALTSAISFQSRLWLATDQGLAGFSLWSASMEAGSWPALGDDWSLVLERGGWRYAINRAVTALFPFGEQLLLATAATGTWLQRLGNHGSEILVIKPGGEWEIVVGQPRFTPAGMKIPLAALGPGFDYGRPAMIDALVASEDAGVCAILRELDLVSGYGLNENLASWCWHCRENLAHWVVGTR